MLRCPSAQLQVYHVMVRMKFSVMSVMSVSVYRVEESLAPHREDEGDVRQQLVVLGVHLRPNTCVFSQGIRV